MKAILHLITVAAAVASSASATPATNNGNNNKEGRDLQGFVCDIPTSGCSNGMFNQAKCECECLSPFCHDMNGDCTNPSNNCGGNVWAQCTRGVNCPWWVNPMKAESCTTGPSVPLGLWQIYNTRTACCNTNFAYSTACDIQPGTSNPTKHPTISTDPEEDAFEVIPIKFDVMGLPDDIKMRELRDEMTTVLKRILIRLADRIPDLKISEVEERMAPRRNTRNLLLRVATTTRELEQNVSLYFNVHVIRDDRKRFGPIIIQEIRDSYGEVMEQIQTFADTKYFGADLDMNWCTSQNGQFNICVNEIAEPTPPPTPVPSPKRAPTSAIKNTEQEPENDGLAGWAVALIVIFVLLLLACIARALYVFYMNGDYYDDETTKVRNNIYIDGGDSVYTGKSRGGGKSVRTNKSRRAIDDEQRSHNSQQLVLAVSDDATVGTKKSMKSHGTRTTKKAVRIPRDPTRYIPGQENKPDPTVYANDHSSDPEGGASSSANGRRYYNTNEDPPLKAKRDPTQFVDGVSLGSGSVTTRHKYIEDPPLKPKRDPTFFVASQDQEDPGVYEPDEQKPNGGEPNDPNVYRAPSQQSANVEEMYNDDDYIYTPPPNRDVIEEEDEEYDQYGFRRSSQLDADDDNDSQSFRTEEPKSVVSGKSRKSQRSKKSSGGGGRSVKGGKERGGKTKQSLHSTSWGESSLPDTYAKDRVAEEPKSRSFY